MEARTGGTQGICISEDAFRQVRGKVATEFADIGEQSLKNIARSLPDLPRGLDRSNGDFRRSGRSARLTADAEMRRAA